MATAFLATAFLVTAFLAGVLAAGAALLPAGAFFAGVALATDVVADFCADFLAGEALAVRRARPLAAATARRTAPPVLLTRTAIVWPSRLD